MAKLHREKSEFMSSGLNSPVANNLTLGSEAVRTSSFDFVFTAYYPYVAKLARTLIGNAQDAEDVTQEVFLRVHKSLSSYDPERGTMSTWLARMTVNACRTYQRKGFFHKLWRPTPTDDTEDALEAVDLSILGAPEDHALQAELRRTVRDVLAKLTPQHRTVLVLHHYMDLSCVEIASILGCPEGTVYSRLHYARRIVQSHLERHLRTIEGEDRP